ncbi:MAG: chemotaxis protein CheA, partial [Tateyamaria sp.]
MTTPDNMAEIRASFFVECEELLEALHDGLQCMEDGSGDAETIHVVFRAVHSIKGGAAAFGLTDIVHFAHGFETALEEVRSGAVDISTTLLKVFFRASDHLSDLVRSGRDGSAFDPKVGQTLLTELEAHIGPAPIDDAETDIKFAPVALTLDLDAEDPIHPKIDETTYTIRFYPEPELFETGNDVFPILTSLSELGQYSVCCDTSMVPPLVQLAPEASYLSWTITLTTTVDQDEILSHFEFVEGLCALEIIQSTPQSGDGTDAATTAPPGAPPSEIAANTTPASAKTSKTASPSSVVRVDIDRIERLVNLVGELVINQAMLSQSLQNSGLSPHSDAMNGLDEFQRLTRDIQDSVMMIRAQPVKSLFQRMSRIVREVSAAVSKDVRLVTEGDTTEVDKTVIERLADPLTHMIRNAVDHGLETTEQRLAKGKSPEGCVRLSAAHRSGRVIIDVSDDGAGIDRARVFDIAVQKGLVAPDAVLSDADIDNLLFMPGFSTSETVSDVSGRGVGMDVVRTEIQALGGRISITSAPGQGTTFSISLPLTLAVLDGMVIDVAGETLVLPLGV